MQAIWLKQRSGGRQQAPGPLHPPTSQPARPRHLRPAYILSHPMARRPNASVLQRHGRYVAFTRPLILIKAILIRRRQLVARGLASLPPTAPYSPHKPRPWFSFFQGGTSCAFRTTYAPRGGHMWTTGGGCQVAGLPPCWSMAAKETGSASTKASKSLSTPPLKVCLLTIAHACAVLASSGARRRALSQGVR